MKKAWCFFLLLSVVFLYCERDFSVFENPLPSREFTALEKNLAQSDNAFGIRLFQEIVRTDKKQNIFISPLSVALALGMALNGADGETEAAIRGTLGLTGMDRDEINATFKGLIDALSSLDRAVRFQIANSVWYELGLDVESDFIRTNKTFFDALVRGLDFGSPDAPGIINGWVSEKTFGKIPKIIDGIQPGQVMFLINAIAFKGNWAVQFDPLKTQDDTFTGEDGNSISCSMMNLETEFDYFQNSEFEAVDMPYGSGDFSMTVLLPRRGKAIDAFIAGFSADSLALWFGSMQKSERMLQFPKFKLEYEIEMTDVLSGLGMGIAFSDRADFTRILKIGGLKIDGVKHKTFVDVNEEGTEAAAVTSISFATSMPAFFRADRPFLYLIREKHSGSILFIGKVVDPTK